MIIVGNDVSKWQGDIDFEVFVKNAHFVIIKATEGNGYTDIKFTRNQSEARRVGLPLGYYHFARPDLGNSPQAEADYFLKIVGSPREGEVYCLDYEPKSNPGDPVAWCKAFLDRVKEAIGVKCFIYLNKSQVKAFDWSPVVKGDYALWIADYTGDPNKSSGVFGKWPSAAIQQWTNAQEVPGIPAKSDGNVFFGDLNAFRKYGYVKPAPPEPPADPGDSEEVKQLKATIANLGDQLKTAELSIQTLNSQIVQKDEIIVQKNNEIKQFPEKTKQAIAEALVDVKKYLYYKKEGGELIGFGFTKLFGGDITPKDLPDSLKGV